ncbi:MAG: Wzz/FepE/Etk N-terminal domain-containing protein [Acidobacteria bacterium]|nr:Wzz/FepE/Etk N-terminal domain-containing protein [Acidobacteriota bacterium]
MQPATPDPMNIQRRTLDIEDYIDVVRRHRAWIVGPMLACLVIGTVTAFLWPDTYVSSAVVRVIPPQIPERFVPSNVNSEISQRINSMYQSITSRQTLTNIINVYQLYPRDRKRLPMEDVIEQMKKDIRLDLTGGENKRIQAFEIRYSYENRLVAQKIVQELVTRFIDENIRTRAAQSSQTTEFLRERFEQTKRDLDAVEEKLTKFRQENQGRMPEERMSNMAALNSLDQRISTLNAQISRANQDKLLLESRLSTLKDQFSRLSVPEAAQQVEIAKNERLAQLEREILNAETNLEAVKQNYKETHPDVRRLKNNIEVLKRTRANLQKDEEAKKAALEKTAANPDTSARKTTTNMPKEARAMEAEIASTQSLIEARNLEVDNARKEIAGVERNIRSYQARIEAAPMGTGQLEELMRERNTAALRYEEMQLKMTQSQAGTELERRNQGETLELLDPASLPMSPTQPKRPLIIAASAVMGIVLGFVIAAVRELKDTTLKNLKDVRAYTQLMILGSVPLLENDLVVRRRRRLAWLAWSTACLAGIAIMAGSVFFYYSNKT